jgi:hypothetical protein
MIFCLPARIRLMEFLEIGLAVYLWGCLTAEPQFPTIDVF